MKKFIFSLVLAVFFVGCEGGGSSTSGTTGSHEVTISHQGGIDFSENDNNVSDNTKQDAYTTVWPNSGMTYATGVAWGDGVWYQNNVTDANELYLYDTTQSDLSSVSAVDTSKWQQIGDSELFLAQDHVYVAKTQDGYVKFKVLSIDKDDWSIKVSYQYSKTTDF